LSTDEYKAKTKFVAKLGLSLHECGATSHRIERHLTNLCQLLGIHGEFLPAQTSFIFIFWQQDPTDQVILIKRTQPSGGNLGLLDRLDALVDKFSSKQLDFPEMAERLEHELRQPNYYNKFIFSLAWAASSFSFSSLLSRSSYDAIVAAIASFIVFYLLEYCAKNPRFNNLSEIIGTSVAAVIISIIAAFDVPLNVPFCILSAVIVMVPGMATTVALNEIASRDLVSGTARFVDAIMALIKLFIGAAIGIALGSIILENPELHIIHDIQDLPEWIIYPAVLTLATAITIAFNIHMRFIFWCLLSSVIAFFVSTYGTENFNQPTGIFLGAFAVGIFSNCFANLLNHPASLVLSTGLIFLVPGSKTYLILNSWVTGTQIVTNTPNATQAFMIFISLVAGLLLSNAIVTTRKSL